MKIPEGAPTLDGYGPVAVMYNSPFFVFYLKGEHFFAVARWDGMSVEFQDVKLFANLLTSRS